MLESRRSSPLVLDEIGQTNCCYLAIPRAPASFSSRPFRSDETNVFGMDRISPPRCAVSRAARRGNARAAACTDSRAEQSAGNAAEGVAAGTSERHPRGPPTPIAWRCEQLRPQRACLWGRMSCSPTPQQGRRKTNNRALESFLEERLTALRSEYADTPLHRFDQLPFDPVAKKAHLSSGAFFPAFSAAARHGVLSA